MLCCKIIRVDLCHLLPDSCRPHVCQHSAKHRVHDLFSGDGEHGGVRCSQIIARNDILLRLLCYCTARSWLCPVRLLLIFQA